MQNPFIHASPSLFSQQHIPQRATRQRKTAVGNPPSFLRSPLPYRLFLLQDRKRTEESGKARMEDFIHNSFTPYFYQKERKEILSFLHLCITPCTLLVKFHLAHPHPEKGQTKININPPEECQSVRERVTHTAHDPPRNTCGRRTGRR
ncbi:hypothetical protein CEXT_262871 [Caerostris extrusa]|uniref:Uncharacterized protein n=1 Tax=Caerostris extrusa TaxID=172846 RepID=A0AAV4Q0Y7_CAEEX|nr:hypothetical protein CEXT_262871 [Caerostris extrusa]